ncbi:DUF3618 domain-containing protein [Streptomyces sporangiiformans]|uniref:DUF3618 domain-containing protein n=2 Tax=Streptomyces sporangiiformans TaxID=2315329 RepID=A0A505DEF9_9ACTN|nr:DUF3618 domain-containing protein [Streptomyces sporangiiformans]
MEAAEPAEATGAGAAGAPETSETSETPQTAGAEEGARTAGRGAKGPDELRQQIAQTRQQLGDTVEELAAKADVRGRARARGAELKGKASGAGHAVQDKAARAGHAVQEVPRPVRTTATAALVAGAGAVVAAGMLRRRPHGHRYLTGHRQLTGRHALVGRRHTSALKRAIGRGGTSGFGLGRMGLHRKHGLRAMRLRGAKGLGRIVPRRSGGLADALGARRTSGLRGAVGRH